MEYNELIERAQHTPVDIPDTDAILGGMRRTVQRRRQRQWAAVGAVCLLLAVAPLFFTLQRLSSNPSPTLAESVSATLPSTPGDLPAPLAGYRHSIRNHQTTTLI